MSELLKEESSTAFVLLSTELSVTQARSQLKPGQYGIVLDYEQAPIALVTIEDLADPASSLLDAKLSPAVIVGSDMSIQQLADSDLITLFDLGAHGAIVLAESGGVAGVLPVEAVDAYLSSGSYESISDTRIGPSASAADAELGGGITTPKGKVVCAKCKYINTISYVDEDYLPPCQNPDPSVEPHTLALS